MLPIYTCETSASLLNDQWISTFDSHSILITSIHSIKTRFRNIQMIKQRIIISTPLWKRNQLTRSFLMWINVTNTLLNKVSRLEIGTNNLYPNYVLLIQSISVVNNLDVKVSSFISSSIHTSELFSRCEKRCHYVMCLRSYIMFHWFLQVSFGFNAFLHLFSRSQR